MILFREGKEYRCPNCHAHISAKPPPACPECGTPLEKPEIKWKTDPEFGITKPEDFHKGLVEKPRQVYRLGVDQAEIDDLREQNTDLRNQVRRLGIQRDLYRTEFNALIAERQQIRDLFPACLDEWGPDLMDAIKAAVAERDELRKARD
jgi:FtsZ-binding cell division protein ZapB